MINKQHGKQLIHDLQSSMGVVKRQVWSSPAGPILAAAATLKALTATSNSVTTTITPTSQPDFPRTISVTPGGTTTDVAAGSYVLTGTNIRGEVITETLTFSADANTAQTSTKAFKTVTSLLVPIQDGAGATFSIGVGPKLGLFRCMSEAAVLDAFMDGVRETTPATVTFNASTVELNTVALNTAFNGTKVPSVYFITTERTDKAGSTS